MTPMMYHKYGNLDVKFKKQMNKLESDSFIRCKNVVNIVNMLDNLLLLKTREEQIRNKARDFTNV